MTSLEQASSEGLLFMTRPQLVTLSEHTTIETRIDPDEFALCQTCGNPLRLHIQSRPYDLASHLDIPPARALYEQQLRDERNEQRQHMCAYTRLTVYTDGASRGNPGPAGAGIHIVDETTSETVEDLRVALGIATNNEAEYQAVLHAVKWLLAQKAVLADDIHITFRLDSQLVVRQLKGENKINKPRLQQLAGEVREHLRQLPDTHTFEHIPREANTVADRLANDTLDKGV